MILNDRQKAVLTKGIATANNILPHVQFLERVAASVPELQQRVDQIRTKRDYLLHVSSTLLDADRYMSEQGG